MTISSFVEVKNIKANHPYKIQTKLAKVNFFKDSFFVRKRLEQFAKPSSLTKLALTKF